jgi:hypothetical protein
MISTGSIGLLSTAALAGFSINARRHMKTWLASTS